MKIDNWIKSNNPPKPNTQCRARTLVGTDEFGQAWYNGKKWWHWEQGSKVKFGLRDGYITHYIPLFERIG